MHQVYCSQNSDDSMLHKSRMNIFLNQCEPDEISVKNDNLTNVNLFPEHCIKTLHFCKIFSSCLISTDEGITPETLCMDSRK